MKMEIIMTKKELQVLVGRAYRLGQLDGLRKMGETNECESAKILGIRESTVRRLVEDMILM